MKKVLTNFAHRLVITRRGFLLLVLIYLAVHALAIIFNEITLIPILYVLTMVAAFLNIFFEWLRHEDR